MQDDESRVFERYRTLCEQIPALKEKASDGVSSLTFRQWHSDVIASLESLCGTNSGRLSEFRAISFGPNMSFGDDDPGAKAKAMINGLDRAAPILDAVLRDKEPVKPSIFSRLKLVGKVPATIVAIAAFLATVFTLLSNIGSLRYSQEVSGRYFGGSPTHSFPGSLENCRDTCVQGWHCKAWSHRPAPTLGENTCFQFEQLPDMERRDAGSNGGIIKWKLLQ
jgi:hypothetical protein